MQTKPKLRFKDKNGNTYPEWEIVTLGDIFNISAGGDIKKNNCTKEKTDLNIYPVYANALTNDGLYGYTNSYKVKSPAITITGRGDVGHAVSRKEPFYPIVRLLVLQPNIELNTDFYTSAINRTKIFVESTGVPQLTSPQVAKVKLFAPCLEEQEKIAGFLSKVDELINECESEVKDLEEQKKGLMQKIFSQQIRFKDSNNNPYPDWEEKFVKDVCDISTGKGNTQDKEENGIYPFYVRSPIIERSNKYIFDGEAVLTVGDGVGTGKVYHYVKGKFNFHQRVYKMSNFNGILGKYFYYYFSTHFYDRVKKMTAKTSVDSVRLEMISKMTILIPCQEEQEKIAKVLSKMDELIEEKKALLSNWQQFKKGLLQQMFV